MAPPWAQYPEIPRAGIGWRMGYGGDYHDEFYRWFSGLTSEAQVRFRESNPEPTDWSGFYDMIAANPWRG
jgi:hypothetical protein